LSLKALVKYSEKYQGFKGSGKFVLYINQDKVGHIPFDDKHSNETNLDFSNLVAEYFKIWNQGNPLLMQGK
jgi:hypothetical protein